ncbi:serine/threonine-protein kinase Nek4 isoform 2-T2 [Mantella aurantiaca]
MEEQTQQVGLENYRIIRVVGKGSYGEVSLASHRAEGKQYVIKKMNLRNAPRKERKAAEQEAQLLSTLKHPNIVAYKGSWEGEDGLLYIVMSYCEGGDLYHKLKDQKGKLVPESQVVEWFVQIAMALQYLHDLHIMHRDLKTQNIFLTKSNIIKVGDLGIARVLESQYDMASTLIGTPYYMSPELFSNKPYNYKSDVWALGCCVYEMATLKHAFNAKDMNSLVYRIIEGKLPPMPKDYSSDLGDLIGTMLSRKPEKRPTVRQILRKPYIKEHIALFLQNSKLKQGRRKKKVVDSSNVSKNNAEKQTEMRAVNMKAASVPSPPPEQGNNMAVSISPPSMVVTDIVPGDKRLPHDEHLIPKAENGCISKDVASKVTRNRPRRQNIQEKLQPALDSKMENLISSFNLEDGDDTMKLLQPVTKGDENICQDVLESTEKLLEPFVVKPDGQSDANEIHQHTAESVPTLSRPRRPLSREEISVDSEKANVPCLRPLPSTPAIQPQILRKCSNSPERKVIAADSADRSKHSTVLSQDNRPLSARERRRLKQSHEEISFSVRKSSTNAVKKTEDINSVSSMPIMVEKKKQIPVWQLSEDDLSSSASSTDKSEGECKERKNSDSSDMNDLVDLMTQTLHREGEKEKSQLSPGPCDEFRIHRKYRDTLMLHGRTDEGQDDFVFQNLPSDNLTVPQKFHRMIEILRADVVKGLGVKVLEQVYNVMDEEDDRQKDLHLQKILGEKYDNYNLKVQQLKFFEENSKF